MSNDRLARILRVTGLLSVALIALAFVSCSGKSKPKKLTHLTGTGATFPAVLYEHWFDKFDVLNDDISVDYKPVGSGGGVSAFLKGDSAKDLDFGASDNGLTDDEVKKVSRGVVQFPVAAGAIALVYNLPGVDNLKLSRKAYMGIFLGEIKNWDHEEIVKHNPGVKLSGAIQPVVRADGSGTTFLFSNHMAAIDPRWKEKYGKAARDIGWPNEFIRKPGNEGVGGFVKDANRSIGYVDLGTAKDGKLKMALVENKAGTFVELTTSAAELALDQAENPTQKPAFVPDPSGDLVYPIVGYTYLMAYRQGNDPAKADALKKLLRWCVDEGQDECGRLGYVRLPARVVIEVRKTIETIGN